MIIHIMLLFHYYVILPYKVKRTRAKYEAVNTVVSWFNRFTTGRIPADAKGATMAELDEPADENIIENRSQNNIFLQ